MDKNILIENSMTILKLKSLLFDIVSEEIAKKSNKNDIINNIFTKSTELLQEIEKLSLNETSSKEVKTINETAKTSPIETSNSITTTNTPIAKENITEEKSQEEKEEKIAEKVKTSNASFDGKEPSTTTDAIVPSQAIIKEESPSSSIEPIENNQSSSSSLAVSKDISENDTNAEDDIVFDNDASLEEPNESEKSKEEMVTEPPKDTSIYPKVSLHKENNDPPRAIIVTLSQFKNLQASKTSKKNEIIENELGPDEQTTENTEQAAEELPTINIDNNLADIKDITASEETDSTSEENKDTSLEEVISKDEQQNQENSNVSSETPSTEEQSSEESGEDIEKLLEEANNLYKEGKVEASQALFEKISALNKAKNDDKVYVKAA